MKHKLDNYLTHNTFIKIIIFIALLYEFIVVCINKEIRNTFLTLLKDYKFLFALFFALTWAIFLENIPIDNGDPSHIKNLKLKKAGRVALLAIIISILASIDLKIAPFWIIFGLEYYYHLH